MATLTQTTKNKTASATKNTISGAEAVVQSLINEGVDLIFGYPGGAIMMHYSEAKKKLNIF